MNEEEVVTSFIGHCLTFFTRNGMYDARARAVCRNICSLFASSKTIDKIAMLEQKYAMMNKKRGDTRKVISAAATCTAPGEEGRNEEEDASLEVASQVIQRQSATTSYRFLKVALAAACGAACMGICAQVASTALLSSIFELLASSTSMTQMLVSILSMAPQASGTALLTTIGGVFAGTKMISRTAEISEFKLVALSSNGESQTVKEEVVSCTSSCAERKKREEEDIKVPIYIVAASSHDVEAERIVWGAAGVDCAIIDALEDASEDEGEASNLLAVVEESARAEVEASKSENSGEEDVRASIEEEDLWVKIEHRAQIGWFKECIFEGGEEYICMWAPESLKRLNDSCSHLARNKLVSMMVSEKEVHSLIIALPNLFMCECAADEGVCNLSVCRLL